MHNIHGVLTNSYKEISLKASWEKRHILYTGAKERWFCLCLVELKQCKQENRKAVSLKYWVKKTYQPVFFTSKNVVWKQRWNKDFFIHEKLEELTSSRSIQEMLKDILWAEGRW